MDFLNRSKQQNLALLDEEFLAELAEQKKRNIYAKIISLDVNENSLDEIQGKATGGTINIDGDSSVRRTCNLTMITQDIQINDYYWGLKTKFKLEIGLENTLTNEYSPKNNNYPDIVWFPMGIFILTTFNTSLNTNSITISLTGKDKMCMLNGELGGQLFASVDFGTEETVSKVFKKISIEPSNSDILMAKTYYREVNELSAGENSSITFLKSDEIYNFEKAKDGKWFLLGDKYVWGLNDDSSLTKKYIGDYYKRYKKVINPAEIFEEIDINAEDKPDYKVGKYYYEKSSAQGFYYLNIYSDWRRKTSSTDPNYTNYKIIDNLYQLEYEYNIVKIPLEKIIREAVHTYAKEPYQNIIINDLDRYGLEQLTYRGDVPLIIFKEVEGDHFTQIALSSNFKLHNISGPADSDIPYEVKEVDGEYKLVNENGESLSYLFGSLTENVQNGNFKIYLSTSDRKWYYSNQVQTNPTFIQYEMYLVQYGDDVGYRITDLVYSGDLISSIGDTLTSILDKIKDMLGEFEYFYDTEGHFVFQKKRTYVNTAWSHFISNDDEKYITFSNDKRKFSFNFEGNRLLTAIQNTPVLNNVRNDFSVWGKRKGISGEDIPIHARYAIDRKPFFYRAFNGIIYTTDSKYVDPTTQVISSRESIRNAVISELENFELEYPIYGNVLDHDAEIFGANIPNNVIPKKTEENGLPVWTPGWWDIRDWARYYELLTGEKPRGTMKWYSHGKFDYADIKQGDVAFENLGSVPYSDIYYLNKPQDTLSRAWLLEIFYNDNGSVRLVSTGHGGGAPRAPGGIRYKCTYQKHIVQDGILVNDVLTKEENDNREKYFNAPYWGCADSHTYTYFLWSIENSSTKRRILFYNPDFPVLDLNTLIDNKVETIYKEQANVGIKIVDWREIIYQMALDYFSAQECSESNPLYIRLYENISAGEEKWAKMEYPDDFLPEVAKRNPEYYPTGYTGYEQYYTDMQGFWRQLYNPDYIPEIKYTNGTYTTKLTPNKNTGLYTKTKVWNPASPSELIIDYYVGGTLNEEGYNFITSQISNDEKINELYLKNKTFFVPEEDNTALASRVGWNRAVYEHPEELNFWIDFLDEGEELSQFAISQIGNRSKTVNEDKASAIVFKEIPSFILYDTRPDPNEETVVPSREELDEKSGYTWIYLPRGFSKYFTTSYRTLSVKNKVDELLYQYGYCIENVTLTAIPVYQLQPNTRIYVCDKDTGIEGEYIVKKLTFSLVYNGTMNITAVKAPERLY